jgi:site-specific recombinase XerD
MSEPLAKHLPTFIGHLQEKGRSPSTVLAYRSDLEQLNDYLANTKNKPLPEQVLAEDLESFRDYLLAENYTAKSTSRKLNAVKTFFRWLKEENHVAEDHSKDVSHPKIEASQPKYLSPLEYRALRDVVRSDNRIAAIVELILQTGMRISEVANLKLHHVKSDIVIIEAYATQPERQVAISQAALVATQNYIKERPGTDHPHLFVSKNGKPLAVRNIRAAIDRYMQKAEIAGYSVNDLRTTFIIENLRRGVDLVTISQAAGHKRLSTTERYLEIAEVKEAGKKQTLEEL